MIDLTTIDQDTIIARGQYSSVNAAHKEELKKLALICGVFGSIAPQLLSHLQPKDDSLPNGEAIHGTLEEGRKMLDKLDKCATEIASLAAQKAALKPIAWPR